MTSRGLGRFGEAWAAGYLTRLGYDVVERNVRYRIGEIDLVARDGDEWVFVEVKCRRSSGYGLPQAAVTGRRFARLERTILAYLADRAIEPHAYRVDVIALEVDAKGAVASAEHLQGVESPEGYDGGRS